MKNHATKTDRANNPLLSISYKSPVLPDNLLYTLPDAVIVTDPNFIITGFNPAAETIYGLSSHDAIGKLLFDLVEFELKGSTLGEAITELHNKGFWNGDILFHRDRGQEQFFNTRCTLIKDESGQISEIVLVNHNVTDRVKQQQNLVIAENNYRIVVESLSETNEKLKQSELLFRSFMTNTPTLGWVYDEDGNLVYGNPLFMEIVGITENAIGKNILEFSTPQMAEPILSKNRHVLQKGESFISEDELIDKTGTVRYFLAHWFILASGDNKRFIGGQAVEITERKKIEAQLLNEQVQKQKNDQPGNFACTGRRKKPDQQGIA